MHITKVLTFGLSCTKPFQRSLLLYDQHLYCHQNFNGSCLASSVNKHTPFMTCTYAPQTRNKPNSHYLEETWILAVIFPFPMTSLHYMWIQLEIFHFEHPWNFSVLSSVKTGLIPKLIQTHVLVWLSDQGHPSFSWCKMHQ